MECYKRIVMSFLATFGRCTLIFKLQKQPRLKLPTKPGAYPLLHLPLSFPSTSSRPLTAWSTVTLCLPSYLPCFSSQSLIAREDGLTAEDLSVRNVPTNFIPAGTYSHLAYIRIYATCRLRRIWFDEGGPGQRVPWEFLLYGNELE